MKLHILQYRAFCCCFPALRSECSCIHGRLCLWYSLPPGRYCVRTPTEHQANLCFRTTVFHSVRSCVLLAPPAPPGAAPHTGSFLCPQFQNLSHHDNHNNVRFEIFTAMTMKNVVFWDIIVQFVLHRRHITSPLQSPAS
jgi:hypothetical protein